MECRGIAVRRGPPLPAEVFPGRLAVASGGLHSQTAAGRGVFRSPERIGRPAVLPGRDIAL